MAEFSWRTVDRGAVMVSPTKHQETPPENGHRLLSPTSVAERARTGKRLLWALPVALALLGILALLGPSAEEVERKFTPYGTDGPLRLMPEIAVEDGLDPDQMKARSEVAPPPPAPEYQVEPEKTYRDAEELTPEVVDEASPITDTGETSDAPTENVMTTESDGDAAVDMFLPSQNADSDFIIRKLVRPLYPLHANNRDRMRSLITVKAGFFLNEQADIIAVMVQSNDGGPEYADAARQAMNQWVFEPRLRNGVPPKPRWLVVTWRFRSPFSAPGQ